MFHLLASRSRTVLKIKFQKSYLHLNYKKSPSNTRFPLIIFPFDFDLWQFSSGFSSDWRHNNIQRILHHPCQRFFPWFVSFDRDHDLRSRDQSSEYFSFYFIGKYSLEISGKKIRTKEMKLFRYAIQTKSRLEI